MGAAAQKVAQTALDKGAEFMDTNPVGKAIKNVLKPERPAGPPQQNTVKRKRDAALKRSATAGGGTPDTQRADQEARRLGQNRMRQAGY